MRISNKGLNLIKEFEGFRSESYKCPASIWTIGYGTTKGVVAGLKITESLGELLLLKDIEEYENCVLRNTKVLLNQCQFDALVSFTYNLGCENLRHSTLLKLLNKGQYNDAAEEFTKWVYSGTTKLNGLVRRREAEKELFLS